MCVDDFLKREKSRHGLFLDTQGHEWRTEFCDGQRCDLKPDIY
jgi:hypothetical protein